MCLVWSQWQGHLLTCLGTAKTCLWDTLMHTHIMCERAIDTAWVPKARRLKRAEGPSTWNLRLLIICTAERCLQIFPYPTHTNPSTYSLCAFKPVYTKAFWCCDYKFKIGALRILLSENTFAGHWETVEDFMENIEKRQRWLILPKNCSEYIIRQNQILWGIIFQLCFPPPSLSVSQAHCQAAKCFKRKRLLS